MSDEKKKKKERRARGSGGGPTGLGNPFAFGGQPDGAMARVSAGIHMEQLPIAGRTIGEIRREFGSRWDLRPDSLAYVEGSPVGDDTVLAAGEMLIFGMRSGEKGAA